MSFFCGGAPHFCFWALALAQCNPFEENYRTNLMTDQTIDGVDCEREERTREIESVFLEETRNRTFARSARKPSLDDYDGNEE